MTFPTQADDRLIENFSSHPEMRWKFIADTVMGGISSGELKFNSERGETYARMTGNVSTENNGGFIQFRAEVNIDDSHYEGLKIKVRGNGEEYFIHIRTSKTRLPWNYYSSSFTTSSEWQWIEIPFNSFKKSGLILPKKFLASDIQSVGMVAFGKDFYANIDLGYIQLY